MTHASLCSGIGGFDLAASWAGLENQFNCEIDPFCRKVLLKHFPESTQYEDLTTTDFSLWNGRVDVLSAGFPCQPYSVAGKQLGAADNRAIWPQVLRVIREVGPTYFLGENVTGIIRLALDEVLASLEAEGYACETFVVPAASVGAPHRRDRVWIVGYSTCQYEDKKSGISGWKDSQCVGICNDSSPNPNCQRLPSFRQQGGLSETQRQARSGSQRGNGLGREWHADFRLTESPICSPNDGVSPRLVRNRGKQLKAYGNAIVPQVALQFFQAIQQHHQPLTNSK